MAVPLALVYGTVVALRYRRLTPELRGLVLAEPATRNRVRTAIAVWCLGVLGVVAVGVYLLAW